MQCLTPASSQRQEAHLTLRLLVSRGEKYPRLMFAFMDVTRLIRCWMRLSLVWAARSGRGRKPDETWARRAPSVGLVN